MTMAKYTVNERACYVNYFFNNLLFHFQWFHRESSFF
jgi:hypothetical protein